MKTDKKEIIVDINGKPVPLSKLPCSKCDLRYNPICPQCDWNRNGQFDVYTNSVKEN